MKKGVLQEMKESKLFNSILYKLSCFIMIFFFGYSFYCTLGNLSHMEIINTYIGETWALMFSICGALTLFLVLYLLQKILFCFSDRTQKYVLFCATLFAIGLQFFMIFGVRPCLRYDSLNPMDTAIALLKGADFSSTISYEYFTIYPHNLPLTGYITALLYIADLLGLSEHNYIVFLQLLNCILIDVSLYALFRLIKKKTSIKSSYRFLILCFLNPLLYYYPVFFYTQVLCMPIITALVVLFFKLQEEILVKNRILYSFLYGIIIFLGWKIRILSLIVPIACGIYLFFSSGLKGSYKNVCLGLFVIVCTFFVCTIGNNHLLTNYGLKTDSQKAFPAHHWIMMGLGDEGTYNLADELFTLEIETKEQRIIENSKIIKQRANDLGVTGLLKLWGIKLSNTWSDGYDDFADNLMLTHHYQNYNDYLSGNRSELLAGYLHIYNTLLWLGLTISAIIQFLKKQPSYCYVILLSILGGMIFHLFWKAGEAYSMPFALLILAGTLNGMPFEEIAPIRKLSSSRLIVLLPIGIIFADLLIFLHLKPTLFDVSFRTKEWAAVQDIAEDDYLELKNGEVFTQTFSASRPFNRMTFQYKYVSESSKEAKGLLRLYDSENSCIYEEFLLTEDYFNGWTSMLPTIIPRGYETFTVEFTPLELSEDAKWVFTAYNTGYVDAYQDGQLYINHIEKENVDLTFYIYNDTQRTLL